MSRCGRIEISTHERQTEIEAERQGMKCSVI